MASSKRKKHGAGYVVLIAVLILVLLAVVAAATGYSLIARRVKALQAGAAFTFDYEITSTADSPALYTILQKTGSTKGTVNGLYAPDALQLSISAPDAVIPAGPLTRVYISSSETLYDVGQLYKNIRSSITGSYPLASLLLPDWSLGSYISQAQLASLLGVDTTATSLQDMTEFELPQKKLQRVQPEGAKDGYLYFQLDTGDASANAPVLVIGLEKSRFFADAIPVHILLTIPEHGVSIQLTGTVSAQTVVLTAPTSRMKDEAFDADRELIAQGVGNILLPFFGGVPATAAIARTSVAIKSGEQTRVTGIVHSLVLLLAMVLLGGVMSRLPLSALAGVLMVTAWRMNEWHGIKTIFSRKVWMGVAQFLITMVSTVVFDLTVAIVIGIVTALLMFVWNAARLTIETEPVDKVRLERLHRMGKPVDESRAKSILVSYVNGSLFFANCADLKRKLLSVDFTGCEHLILSLRGVSATDISGVQTLMEVCALIAQKGVTVSICGVHENVAGFFQKVGLTDQLGAAAFYPNASEAVIDTLAQEQAGA